MTDRHYPRRAGILDLFEQGSAPEQRNEGVITERD
jgi:hypothetical protein